MEKLLNVLERNSNADILKLLGFLRIEVLAIALEKADSLCKWKLCERVENTTAADDEAFPRSRRILLGNGAEIHFHVNNLQQI